MKKYNSWEELKECFTYTYEFECEGEIFFNTFSVPHNKSRFSRHMIVVKGTYAGVKITVQNDTIVDTHFYNARKTIKKGREPK